MLRLEVEASSVGPAEFLVAARGDFQGSAETLETLLEMYPDSGISDQALFLLGTVYESEDIVRDFYGVGKHKFSDFAG